MSLYLLVGLMWLIVSSLWVILSLWVSVCRGFSVCDFGPFERGWMTVAVRVTGIPQDLHGGHDMPLRDRAYRWDSGKMTFGKDVRKEGTRKKRGVWGVC